MADSSSNSFDLDIARIKAATDILVSICGHNSINIHNAQHVEALRNTWNSLHEAIVKASS